MKKTFTLFLLSVALLALGSTRAKAQNIFVKIIDADGHQINGGSTDRTHPNEINATSFGQENTGCATPGGPGGPGACGGTPGHFIFNAILDQSYPLLNNALFTSSLLRSVDIVFRKSAGAGGAGVEYYKIHLERILISHITNNNDATTSPVQVQVELAAEKMGWTYFPQKADGSLGTAVKFGWDATTKTVWTSF